MPDASLHLRSWNLPASRWADMLAPLADEDALLLAECPGTLMLARADRLTALQDDAASTTGHLFTPEWHLTWRSMGARVRAVAVGPVPVPDAWGLPDAEEQHSGLLIEDRELLLWGVRQPGDEFWMELRIPRMMRPPDGHPAAHAPAHRTPQRRALHVRTYYLPGEPQAVYTRLRALTYPGTADGPADAVGVEATVDTAPETAASHTA